MNQDSTSNKPSLAKLTKTEKNKRKKIKYKLKKNLRKTRTNQHSQPTSTSTATRRWFWKSLKSKTFSRQQRKLLFQVHNISSLKERNNVMIYNFKSTLTTSTYKNNKGNLDTTTSTDILTDQLLTSTMTSKH